MIMKKFFNTNVKGIVLILIYSTLKLRIQIITKCQKENENVTLMKKPKCASE